MRTGFSSGEAVEHLREGVTADKRGETCEWRGTGVMLQGQGEGSVESNAKRGRRVMVEVKKGGGEVRRA